jgi:hypothetical protein
LKEHGSEMVAPLCTVRNPWARLVYPKSMFKKIIFYGWVDFSYKAEKFIGVNSS